MSNVSMVDGHIDENKMTDIKKLTEDLEYARYHCTSNKGKDTINDAIALINRQQKDVEELCKVLGRAYQENCFLEATRKCVRVDAIKEFAERLKEEFTTGSAIMRISVLNIVDDLVKEMIGENK